MVYTRRISSYSGGDRTGYNLKYIGYVDFNQRRNQCRFSGNILRAGNRWQCRQRVCRLFSSEHDLCLTFIMVKEHQKRQKITVFGSGTYV